jgi:hypothetical protein
MLELLKRWFSWSPGQRRHRLPAGPRPPVRLTVDALEDRLALSLTPLPDFLGLAGRAFLPAFHGHHRNLFIPKVSQIQFNSVDKSVLANLHLTALAPLLAVPDLSRVIFVMVDPAGGQHVMSIANEFFNQDGTARFDGEWSEPGDSGATPFFTGQLAWRRQGILVTVNPFAAHFFEGYITAHNGLWHIDGQESVAEGVFLIGEPMHN